MCAHQHNAKELIASRPPAIECISTKELSLPLDTPTMWLPEFLAYLEPLDEKLMAKIDLNQEGNSILRYRELEFQGETFFRDIQEELYGESSNGGLEAISTICISLWALDFAFLVRLFLKFYFVLKLCIVRFRFCVYYCDNFVTKLWFKGWGNLSFELMMNYFD